MFSSEMSRIAATAPALSKLSPMAGMAFQSAARRLCGGIAQALERRRARRRRRFAVGPRVQFDAVGTQRFGNRNLHPVGIDEERYLDTALLQPPNDAAEPIVVGGDIESAFGRQLRTLLGDEARLVGARRERDLDHLLRRRHFQVERKFDVGLESANVVVGYVAAVFPQMRRDAVGSRGGGYARGADRVGMAAAARVANGRHMIDVDAQSQCWIP